MKRYKPIKKLDESILDSIKPELNEDIFSNNRMRPDIRTYLVDIFMEWLSNVEPGISVDAMVLIGSSASYRYNDSSDIDINIQLSETPAKLFKLLPNGNILPNTNHPINYYLAQNDSNVKNADNSYDILNDMWIKEPEKLDVKVPYSYALEIAKLFINGIDSRIAEYEADTRELQYLESIVNDNENDRDDVEERISIKNEEIKADLDAISIGYHLIKSFRKEAYDPNYEVSYLIQVNSKNPNFSINNIVYKILENFGYFEKLDVYMKRRNEKI